MLDWYDLWKAAFNDFMQEYDVTDKYIGLDESTVPALVCYRYYKDDRFEDMQYDYKWAFPTRWTVMFVK